MITEQQINDILVWAINDMLPELKEEIDLRTPEDTLTLLGNNTIEHAKIQWNTVKGEVYNDTEYAEVVEYGVSDMRNYHKPKGTVMMRGYGARMFTLAMDSMQDTIEAHISSAIEKWISKLTK